jgi:predicted kinase
MATIYMLVGIPSSGKSSWAKENAKKLSAEICSSDSLRKELYGDESIQGDNNKLFDLLHARMKSFLNNEHNVIYDATNISQKRRIQFNKEFKDYRREVIYFNTSYHACVMRDAWRERRVGADVIRRMFHNLQVPVEAEGWDKVSIVYDEYINPFKSKEQFEELLLSKPSHDEMFALMNFGMFKEFTGIYNLAQDNPHHSFSVSRHTYYVYDYIINNYDYSSTEDLIKMLWVAVLHDVGKGYTKSFLNHKGEQKRYASYRGHQNVSAQIGVSILHSLGYNGNIILDIVEIVQLHMDLLNIGDSEKGLRKLRNKISEETYNKLLFFKEADTSAK